MSREELSSPPRARRVATLLLSELFVEATQGSRALSDEFGQRQHPFGVIVQLDESGELSPRARLHAVNPTAKLQGVRPGQSIAEARVLTAKLSVYQLPFHKLEHLLLSVAEVAREFGPLVSTSHDELKSTLEAQASSEVGQERPLWHVIPAVWVDVTGSAHLYGGEQELCAELCSKVRRLGHAVRVTVANGPEIGRAISIWGPPTQDGITLVPPGEEARLLEHLPIFALPFSADAIEYFNHLGVLTLGQFRALPPEATSSRLLESSSKIAPRHAAEHVGRLFALSRGIDVIPLVPCTFPEVMVEVFEYEEPLSGIEPVLFSLRGLTARLSARLNGRGRATTRLQLRLQLAEREARALAELNLCVLDFELATPLWREGELFRVLKARLEQLILRAPLIRLELTCSAFTEPYVEQLGLGGRSAHKSELIELPLLLRELEVDVGANAIGYLEIVPSHRPEAQSRLTLKPPESRGTTSPRLSSGHELSTLTRLFHEPLKLPGPLNVGASLLLSKQLYIIQRLRFLARLQGVEWWTETSTHRDYLWVLLQGNQGTLEALTFIDKRTGERFLQGLWD